MLGRILPLTTLILPFWIVRQLCKTREVLAVWPGLLACGVTFGAIQFFWSNYINSALVDIMGGILTLLLLAFFFRKVWSPKQIWRYAGEPPCAVIRPGDELTFGRVFRAWSPYLLLAAVVVLWGISSVSKALDVVSWKHAVPGLDKLR